MKEVIRKILAKKKDLWIKDVQEEVKERQEEEKGKKEALAPKEYEKIKEEFLGEYNKAPFHHQKDLSFVSDLAEEYSKKDKELYHKLLDSAGWQKHGKIIKAAIQLISYTPPKDLFAEGSAKKIAEQLKKDSKNLKQAMSRLNFYINRAGKNLTAERSKVLENAKEELRKMYKK